LFHNDHPLRRLAEKKEFEFRPVAFQALNLDGHLIELGHAFAKRLDAAVNYRVVHRESTTPGLSQEELLVNESLVGGFEDLGQSGLREIDRQALDEEESPTTKAGASKPRVPGSGAAIPGRG